MACACVLFLISSIITSQSRIALVIPNNFESYRLVCPDNSPFDCAATDGEFTQTKQFDLANHRFYEGYFGCENANAVITTSGLATINAALTTQLVIETYRNTDDPIDMILTYGIAGGMDDRLSIGDVVVPAKWAIYNLWNWQDEDDGPDDPLQLEMFGDYDRDFGYWDTTEYHNVWFQPQELFLEPEVRTRTMFFEVDSNALAIMKSIEAQIDDKLINCIPEEPTECLSYTPTVHLEVEGEPAIGLTADIFVDNAAWRQTLFDFYGAQSIDMETGAMAMVAATNEIPFLAFRSVSDLAGGEDVENAVSIFLALAVENSITVLTEWLDAAYCAESDIVTTADGEDEDYEESNEQWSFAEEFRSENMDELGTEDETYKIVIEMDRMTLIVIFVVMIVCLVGMVMWHCFGAQKVKRGRFVSESGSSHLTVLN